MIFFQQGTWAMFSYLPFVDLWARRGHKHTLLSDRQDFLSEFRILFHLLTFSTLVRKSVFHTVQCIGKKLIDGTS